MKYHIDTDMGVDDSLALAVANALLGSSLTAISTVFGNVDVITATRNALILRRLFKRADDLVVVSGAPCASDGFQIDARAMHGDDGIGGATRSMTTSFLGDVDSEVSELDTISTLDSIPSPGGKDKIVIIGLGPATNLPRIAERYGPANIERIVLMTGVFLDVGNITPNAEFNAHLDPLALNVVVSLGIPITIVPLDLCRKIQLSRTLLTSLLRPESSPLSRLIFDSHMTYMDSYRKWEGIDGCFPHDAIAVLAAIAPEWLYLVPVSMSADCGSRSRGLISFTVDPSSHVTVAFGGTLKSLRAKLESVLMSL